MTKSKVKAEGSALEGSSTVGVEKDEAEAARKKKSSNDTSVVSQIISDSAYFLGTSASTTNSSSIRVSGVQPSESERLLGDGQKFGSSETQFLGRTYAFGYEIPAPDFKNVSNAIKEQMAQLKNSAKNLNVNIPKLFQQAQENCGGIKRHCEELRSTLPSIDLGMDTKVTALFNAAQHSFNSLGKIDLDDVKAPQFIADICSVLSESVVTFLNGGSNLVSKVEIAPVLGGLSSCASGLADIASTCLSGLGCVFDGLSNM